MRKEIETTDTRTEYYCDRCGEEIRGYTSYGSPTYPEELVKVCAICEKDVCPKCRGKVYHWHICKDCLEGHKGLIDEIAQNESGYRKKCQELNQKLKSLMNLIPREIERR